MATNAAANAAAAAATTATTVVRKAKIERKFFKNPEIVEGFKVFDTYMNKKREPFVERAKKVSERASHRRKKATWNETRTHFAARHQKPRSMSTLATIG